MLSYQNMSHSSTVYVLYFVNYDDPKRKSPEDDILGVFGTYEDAAAVATNEDVMEYYGADMEGDADNAFLIVERTLGKPIKDVRELMKK